MARESLAKNKNGIIIPKMNISPQDIIKHALLILLRPLVRFLLKNEISHSEFSEIAKEVFVHAALEDLTLPGRKPTVSRAAVLTGLSRKEVSRIAASSEENNKPPKLMPNRAARVITGWLENYADSTGKKIAKTLSKDEFNALIKQYSGDITYGAITDELKRLGIIDIDQSENYHLIKSGYIVAERNIAEGFNLLSHAAANLLATGEYNLSLNKQTETTKARFQKQLTLHNIAPHLQQAFKQYANRKAMELLVELNQWHTHQLHTHQLKLNADDIKNNDKSTQPHQSSKNVNTLQSTVKNKIHSSTDSSEESSVNSSATKNKTLGIGIYYFEHSQGNEDNEK